jgi:hypothetical protein
MREGEKGREDEKGDDRIVVVRRQAQSSLRKVQIYNGC